MTPAPRIAYLAGEYPAVSHTFILREVAALRAQGLEVQTCSIRRTGPEHHRGPAEQAAAQTTFNVLDAAKNPAALIGAQLAALRHPGRYLRCLALALRMRGPGLGALLYQLFYFVEATVLARHLRAQNITHLHNHFAQASCTVALLTSELSGIPFSFTLHGPADFTDPRLWRLDTKIAHARFVACISHFCRSQAMMQADPAHWPRLQIVHCGVDPARYGTKPRTASAKELLFVGRMSAVKGVPILLQAFADVRTHHKDARLTLVGDGPERAALAARAAALKLDTSVRFTGYQSQDEVAALLAQSDVFVLPSFAEGVPVVLMEAMAARLPVVATRIAGIPELVEDGTSGRIVAPGDAAALAAALHDILSAPKVARAMGAAGRAKVAKEFDIDQEAAKLAALLRAPPERDAP
jgi:glycosyltransferase involved in cell wall biosynthesis